MISIRSRLKKPLSVLLSAVMVLSLVALGVAGSSGVAAAETELTDCTEITASGTYVLGSDLEKDQIGNDNACIRITADDVYLDGNGHTITGGAQIEFRGGNYGIKVVGATNVTVTNVHTRGWDHSANGIYTNQSADVIVRDVTTSNNSIGLTLKRTDGFTVENVTAVGNNRGGMQSYNSSMGVFRDVTAVNNSKKVSDWNGISVRDESSDVLVENVTVTGSKNGGDGIRVSYDVLSNVTIRDATVLNNDGAGLRINTGAVQIEDVTARGNNWSFVMEDIWQADGPPKVEGLDIGNSTAPNTTLSFEAWNVRVRGNATPPDHPDEVGIGRYLEVEEIGNGYLNVSVDWTVTDLSREVSGPGQVSSVRMYFWQYNGTNWVKNPEREYGYRTISANVTDSGPVGIFGPGPVASYEVIPVNETVVWGEPLEVELTNVTDSLGHPYTGYTNIEFELPNGTVVTSGTSVDDGEGVKNLTVLDGNETEGLETGTHNDLKSNLLGEELINDTYDLEVTASPVSSFEVEPTTETVVQGELLTANITNVTDVRGGPFTGELELVFHIPNSSAGVIRTVSIVDGETMSPVTVFTRTRTRMIEPSYYNDVPVTHRNTNAVNDTYNVSVKESTFTVESEFAGVVHDDSGIEINATWLVTENGTATLTVAGQDISVPVTNRNVSTTVDLSEHLDPATTTGVVTVEFDGGGYSALLTDEVRLVHEAYGLGEGYTRWSIPQPAELYVTDGVVDMTQWSDDETSYDDVGFQVNAGETVTDGEDLHKGLYVNAGTADERIGYDFVTPGEAGLPAGGAESIDEGWNLLSSNYDASSGNRTLNLDLDTVSSLPATAADYEGDEAMVARSGGSLVRIGGDNVIEAYDTYWVYVDVGEDGETRAIVTAEYKPDDRAEHLEALVDEAL